MPLGHLGINVTDLRAATVYYDDLMPRLSFDRVPLVNDHEQVAYMPSGGKVGAWLFLYASESGGAYARDRAGFQHMAFIVKTRAEVDALHEWALDRGSKVLHPPKEWPEYHPGYYALFWLDPNGFMLEVVCHRDTPAKHVT